MNDGISHFKRSFSDHEDMLVGTYDRPLSPLYIVWSKGLPLAKKIVRSVRKR
jgi:lipid II:glycine glycyltransferase (peptidoglycan interpeptide bridge formation enzyme)